jgi:hypothetical protein
VIDGTQLTEMTAPQVLHLKPFSIVGERVKQSTPDPVEEMYPAVVFCPAGYVRIV